MSDLKLGTSCVTFYTTQYKSAGVGCLPNPNLIINMSADASASDGVGPSAETVLTEELNMISSNFLWLSVIHDVIQNGRPR